MFGGIGNLASMLKNAPEIMRRAQEMQGRMAEIQEALAKVRVEGSAGGGMVRVQASGQQRIVGVSVEESVLGDREMLEDLLVAAANQALEKAREAHAREMSKLTGGMDLGNMNDMLAKMGLGGMAGAGSAGAAGEKEPKQE